MLHICFALSYFFVSIYSNNISLYFHLVNKFFLLYTVFMDSPFAKLSQEEKKVLSDYFQNHFSSYNPNISENLSFLNFWKLFIQNLKEIGTTKTINSMLIPKLPLNFNNPEGITAFIYESEAGKIPVINIKNTEDFENLTTNLIYKGKRPENLNSTGASFVYGKSTRFILLSAKPYSNVSASTLGLKEEDWLEKSMKIRLEHECSHFFTKRFFGNAQNHLHDELIADFFGLLSAFGNYSAEYFEYFMGIKGSEGSRLFCYIPDSSPEMLAFLKEIASKASHKLEEWSLSENFQEMTHLQRMCFLCEEFNFSQFF